MATNTLPQSNSVEDIEKAIKLKPEEAEALKKALRTINKFILASGWVQGYFKDLHVKNNIDKLHPDNVEFHAFFAMMLRIERLFDPAMDACDEIQEALDISWLEFPENMKEEWGGVK